LRPPALRELGLPGALSQQLSSVLLPIQITVSD